jgi:uncharacterized protein (DUF433 family)
MPPNPGPLFTPSEAAVLTRLSVKAVNNAIDKQAIPAATGCATRMVGLPALMMLALERRLSNRFVPELRGQVFAALGEARRNSLSLEGGLLKLDLCEPRRELAGQLRQLRRVRQLVDSDPEVMGGDPVFRGTRIPVHAIATQLAHGDSPAEVLRGYPRLTAEMVALAPIYAAAYPSRGRPRAQPWHDRPPIAVTRRKLATNEAG